MFGFSKEEKETVDSEQPEIKKSGVWSGQLGQAIADARKGRVDSEKGFTKGAKNSQPKSSGGSVSRELSEAARKMFEPDAWRAIVRAPFALGKVITGRECWDLEKRQEDTLATSTSMTAEYFMAVDPKYVALTICMFNWSVILNEKYAASAREARLEKASVPEPKIATVAGIKSV